MKIINRKLVQDIYNCPHSIEYDDLIVYVKNCSVTNCEHNFDGNCVHKNNIASPCYIGELV